MKNLKYYQTALLDLTYGNALHVRRIPGQDPPATGEVIKLLDTSFKNCEEMANHARQQFYKFPNIFKLGYAHHLMENAADFYIDVLREFPKHLETLEQKNPQDLGHIEFLSRVKTSPYRYVFSSNFSKNTCFPIVDIDLNDEHLGCEQHCDYFYANFASTFLGGCSIYKIISSREGRWYFFDYPIANKNIPMFNGLVKEHISNVIFKLARSSDKNTRSKIFGIRSCDYRYLNYSSIRQVYFIRAIAKCNSIVPCPDKPFNDIHYRESASDAFRNFTNLVNQHFDSNDVMTLAFEMNL